ncbi:cytochrome C biogenesis protein [Saccharomonospora piscinae]|uniref:Cytochrome C biogenesis protein n=1 Tax=Saccharomonospora piscinae TaxID=687388 RepID=A0A1V9ABQ0_SACPI|nr:ESX secretion-associated protein EspG [Saccharomonospora piscinae]OQO94557.1 cytochrome C biogenesis protein [Saccharomonospora piscinae]
MTTIAEHAAEGAIALDLVELDLLATEAGTRPPFPLRVPSFGRIEGERTALLAGAARSLAERGLATGQGPTGLAADLVAALRDQRGTLDLVVAGDAAVTGVVALVRGESAVVCRQSLAGVPGRVSVTTVTAVALTDEFTGLVPPTRAARAMPITLPPGVVGDAIRLLENTAGAAAPHQRVRTLVRERGGDPAAVDALLTLLPSVSGRGQLGTVRYRNGHAERGPELSWLDSPSGRVRVHQDDRGWVSVNPLRHSELVHELRAAAARART